MMSLPSRSHVKGEDHGYISPVKAINAGIWSLFAGATVFLALRLWCKISRKHGTGIWYDDHILIASWLVLFMNDILISVEYATGYVQEDWDDRMRIMVNISTCGTLVGQALSKTAFAVTLLRISNKVLSWILWFCIVTMHLYMWVKIILQWAKIKGNDDYDVWYRFDFYITDDLRDQIKRGGNIYNMMMDFVFAVFPWLITWNLRIGRREKISLCITLSLGMIIAISTAVRTLWKKDDVEHDEWYFWTTAMGQIWFSSEICGTIIVQCVPILRPFFKEVTPTLHPSFAKNRSRGSSFARSAKSSFARSSRNRQSTRNSIPLQSIDRPEGPILPPVRLAAGGLDFSFDRTSSTVPAEDVIRFRPDVWSPPEQPPEQPPSGRRRSEGIFIHVERTVSPSQVSPLSDMEVFSAAQQGQGHGDPVRQEVVWPFSQPGLRGHPEAVSPASWLDPPSPVHSVDDLERGRAPPAASTGPRQGG